MEQDRLKAVDQRIHSAARKFASDGLSAQSIERFLRTNEQAWNGIGSSPYSRVHLDQEELSNRAAKAALRTLFDSLAELLPPEVRTTPPVAQETIKQRVEPMVKGLVQIDWQEIALRELTKRTFVLNFPGTKAALDAELSTGWLKTPWQVLWLYFEDYGLKPDEIQIECDGLSGGEFAHVRWSACETTDPYSDVVVHEAAHLLHYLKPQNYGLRIRRGQERFVDVEFRHRELFAYGCEAFSRVILKGERNARIAFATRMREDAFSFSVDHLEDVASLVVASASARNGWRTIRDATT